MNLHQWMVWFDSNPTACRIFDIVIWLGFVWAIWAVVTKRGGK